MATNSISGVSFPVPCHYAADNGNNNIRPPIPMPMPMAQPFQHDTVTSESSQRNSPPAFRPAYGSQHNGTPGSEIHARIQQAQYYSPPPPAERSSVHFNLTAQPRTASPESYDGNAPFPHDTPFLQGTATHRAPPEQQRSAGLPQNVTRIGGQTQGDGVRQLTAEDIKPNESSLSKSTNAVHELDVCRKIFEQCDDKFVSEL